MGPGADPSDRFVSVVLNSGHEGGPVLKRVWGGGGRGIPLRGWYVVSLNSSEYVFLKNDSQVDESKVGEPDVESEKNCFGKAMVVSIKRFLIFV